MKRESLNWWVTFFANLGVLGGLVFVGFEIHQNTAQLRADGAQSITEMVNDMNAGVYSDPSLAEILMRGTQDRTALDAVERERFDLFQFSRLNIAEYTSDLEKEGISDLNFRYTEFIVREFNERPGLQQFIREYEKVYVGSDELLARLLGR